MSERRGSSNSEFNWSTYHDKQLNLFDTLAKSFSNSNRINESISRGLSDTMMMMRSIANSLGANSSTSPQSQSSRGDFMSHGGFTVQAGRAADSLRRAAQEAEDLARAHEEAAQAAIDQARADSEAEENRRIEAEKTKRKIAEVVDNMMHAIDSIGKQANKFSETSNQLLQNSGMSGSDVRDFRASLMSDISDLNKRTGYAYNSQAAYQSIVDTVKGVTSSLEAIDEMSTPLLLAQEGMNVDTHQVAQLLNKLYVRYSFSSSSMEELLDNIRSNTAGNSANEAATLANIEKLQNIMALDITDNETRKEYMEAISDITSHAESMGMDSGTLADMMKQIWEGSYSDNPLLMNILSHGGMDGNATSYLRSGDANSVRSVYEALINGITSIVAEQKDAYSRGATISNTTGMTLDAAANIFGAVTSENYQNLEEFLANIDPTSVADVVEDKYVSAMDKANNWLSQIYSKVATLQEWTGFGLTDIAGIYFLGKKFLGLFGGSSGPESAGFIGKIAKGVTTNLAKAGGGNALLGGLGVTAGLAMTGYGAVNAANSFKEGDTGHGIGYSIGAAGGAIGTAALLAGSGPIGWTALALGGVALAATELHKSMTPVSGAAKGLKKSLEESRTKFVEEQAARALEIESIKNTAEKMDSVEDIYTLFQNSGLFGKLDSASSYTKESLLALANAAKGATVELGNEGDQVYRHAEAVITASAKEETKGIMKDLHDMLSSDVKSNGGMILENTNATEFAYYEKLFKDMGNTITNKEDKKNWLSLVEEVLSDGMIDYSDSLKLFDQGGFMHLGIKGELARKNSIGRAEIDFEAFNNIISSVGIDGYSSMIAKSALDTLMNHYSLWLYATGEEKSKYAKAFKDTWEGLTEDTKSLLRDDLSEIASKMNITPFAVGTNYIPHDMPAFLHEGEAVVPKKYNPAADGRLSANEISELVTIDREAVQQSQQTKEYTLELLKEMTAIKEFLALWQQDNIQRERASEIRARNSLTSRYVNQYFTT